MRGCWIGVLLGVGCSGTDPAEDKGPVDTDTPGVDTATTDTDTDTTPGEDTSASLRGTVSSPGGPLVDVPIRLCRGSVCRNATTDATGLYTYEDVAVDWFSFEVVPPQSTAYATAFAAIELRTQEARVLDVILLPHDPPSALGPTAEEHEVGDGLFVTLAAADLVPPILAPEATEVSGVLVPEGQRLPTDGITGTVLGMWYVEPFDYAAATGGIPARFEDRWALADGTTLEVWVGSYAESRWLSGGTVTAGGGELTGASLPLLSTVLLVQP